jgi:ABC-2 type transport system permease protein
MLRLLAFQIRRDRLVLPIWILGTALMAYASAAGVQVEFPTDADRETVVKLAVATPSLLALRGIPDGTGLGSYIYFQVFTYLGVLAGLMSTFLVVRHTRADEERGRAELVAATPVARTSPLVASVLLGVLANAVLGLAVGLAFTGGGLTLAPSLVAGLATASVGLVFVGITAVIAQLAPASRSANGVAGALVGVAFGLRAVGDALGAPTADGLSVVSAWPSWLSPIGWGQQVFPFTRADAAPLLISLAVGALGVAAALVIRARRDLGSSLVSERPGRARGRATLRSSLGLAWREQWPSLSGWAVGGAVIGSLAGALGPRIAEVQDLAPELQSLLQAFVPGGRGELIDLLVAAIVGIGGVLAAGAGVQAIIRARSEEADGRAELVLAGPVGRVRWLLDWVLVAVVSVVVVSLAIGVVGGLSFGDADRFASTVLAGIAQIPAGLAYVGVTALIFVVIPRLTIALGWGLLGLGLLLGQFGGLMQLPTWVRDVSPFSHTPAVPGADVDWSGAVGLAVVAVVAVALAAVLARRRQLTS